MGSRHPLDIFRSTDDGFDHASRRRRTVSGKVLGSNSRTSASASKSAKAVRGAGLLGAQGKSKAKANSTASRSKVPKPLFSKSSSSAANAARKLLYGVGVVVVIFALVFAIKSTFEIDSTGNAQLPTLKASEAAALLDGSPIDDLSISTVLAATYPPTEHGLTTAWNAHDELASRGFESIDVAQILGDDGNVAHYQLVIGRAAAGTLGNLRKALQRINDWPATPANPFTAAQVMPHPLAND